MSVTSDYYLARAAESAAEAEKTTLANVRERSLRSEAAWRSMATRLLRGEAMRETLAAAKESASVAAGRSSVMEDERPHS